MEGKRGRKYWHGAVGSASKIKKKTAMRPTRSQIRKKLLSRTAMLMGSRVQPTTRMKEVRKKTCAPKDHMNQHTDRNLASDSPPVSNLAVTVDITISKTQINAYT